MTAGWTSIVTGFLRFRFFFGSSGHWSPPHLHNPGSNLTSKVPVIPRPGVGRDDTGSWWLSDGGSIELGGRLLMDFFRFERKGWDRYLEPETSVYKWLFQLDDEQNLYIGKGCLTKHPF